MVGAARRRTKIVATIGPASEDRDTLRALVDAGMDGARLNFSHGTHADHARRNALIREVQGEVGRPLSVIADLQGPKLRVGELPEPVVLERGGEITLVGGNHASDGALSVSPAVIGDVLRAGKLKNNFSRFPVSRLNGVDNARPGLSRNDQAIHEYEDRLAEIKIE